MATTAAAAGTWILGDLTVNRMGFGAMRLAGAGPAASRGGPAPAGEAVSAIARAHDATPAQVRLAWTLHRGPHVLAIPGTGDPAHLGENIDAAALRLSPQEISSLAATPLPSSPNPSDPPD